MSVNPQNDALQQMIAAYPPPPSMLSNQHAGIQHLSESLLFNKFSPEEVFDTFADHAKNGCLNRKRFHQAHGRLLSLKGITLPDQKAAATQLDFLFTAFDENHDAVIDFEELASGLSLLSGGTREQKVKAAFNLFVKSTSTRAFYFYFCYYYFVIRCMKEVSSSN